MAKYWNQTFRNMGNSIGPIIATTILASFVTVYAFSEQGYQVTQSAPSPAAYQFIFGLIAVLGFLAFATSLAFRNFRYDDKGRRVDLAVGRGGKTADSLRPEGSG